MPRYHPGTYKHKETHTPLYYAAINGHTDAMALLFELGADLVKYDEDADTVLRSIVRDICRYESHGYHSYGNDVTEMLEDYRDADGRHWFRLYEPDSDPDHTDEYDIGMWDPRTGYDGEGY